MPETLPELLEDLPADPINELHAKMLLDDAISRSTIFDDLTANRRELQIRWELAKKIDLSKIKGGARKGTEHLRKTWY
ncbi:hypothetical protein KFU94_42835 [Chloroflexi bacterium TSY]|nr:hypothetical protein [Chloroflexi bacterium TSY]